MHDRLALLDALIGRPYRVGATGPDAFDCYGLARHVQATVYGTEMPALAYTAATTREQAEAMLAHPERARWTEVSDAQARDGDLVLMGNVIRRDFHLGTFVVPVTAGVILHVDQGRGVVADDLPALRSIGFVYTRLFRRTAEPC
ncbi:NlpC/P60 family protein [Methylobacterium sp. WSM2598]|uniref:NlpC/P60 family protein n=1 Tax=Methylobacterium sp. WSM2598 TaxID=398261 RepID=UPI00037AB05A|nr:NlpC/P60 family protein [Methylobacterium sp. WSM2598]